MADSPMILYGSQRSPFARKVRIAVRELALESAVDERFVPIELGKLQAEVAKVSPLAQIPTLVTGDGVALYDSLVICEYLDLVSGRHQLFPAEPMRRIDALRRHAIGNTTMERLLRLMGERMDRRSGNPQPTRVPQEKLDLGFSAMDGAVADTGGAGLDIGSIAIVTALTYADFRLSDLPWREGRPRLAAWFEEVCRRPAIAETGYVA